MLLIDVDEFYLDARAAQAEADIEQAISDYAAVLTRQALLADGEVTP